MAKQKKQVRYLLRKEAANPFLGRSARYVIYGYASSFHDDFLTMRANLFDEFFPHLKMRAGDDPVEVGPIGLCELGFCGIAWRRVIHE